NAVKYFSEGNIEKAEENFQIALSNKPDNLSTLKYLAQIAIAKQNLPMIKFYYDKVLELDSNDEDALISLGVIYLNNGNIKSAEELFIKAVNNQPDNELALFNLGVLYATIGEFSKAVNTLNKLISTNPNNGEYYQTLGMYYLTQGIFTKAEFNFLKALKLDTKLIEARKGLIILYQNQNELNKSSKLINELEAISPDLQYLNILKANQHYLREEINSAIKYALAEISKYPDEPDAYFLLNDLYRVNGDFLKAENTLIKAKKNSSRNYTSFYSLLKMELITNNK
ncbi:MAG: tetratricopeptide repeat protein, partial [Ignavibacteria bacterium]|nr:tetratricopeptide repeat protein [Ignavibacteria bacterium]